MLFNNFVFWGFCSLLSGCAIYGVTILSSMQKSIESLNRKMATVIAKHDSQGKLIEDLNDRVKYLEHTKER